ncbi:DUF302 domain-containing protein [Aidingimonas halophila]|uniref:DUF302 domain-containing protein n=1 Tax=Aidingimonas halophila TaxID=574349 RepID=A0A1H2SAR2_9GAMM|nr:DUF302 domain-containing protein [Aidingimonas halophila]GHC17945.1 hypothetical protein GCM10008094_04580 [Aidingimonas halophila]SDW28627.1 protein of unknown function DUF302 [Aidingimonas halophila]
MRTLGWAPLTVAIMMSCSLTVSAHEAGNGIEHRHVDVSVDVAEDRLRDALDARDINLVALVDHASAAADADLSLPETRTAIFGNPKAGTPLMQCQGRTALDLPMKMVIRETDEGVMLEWNSMDYLADRHGLAECDGLPLENLDEALQAIAADVTEAND